MRTYVIIVSILMSTTVFLLGCAGSKDPIGGDTGIACFDLEAQPQVFTKNQNTLMKLVPTFPDEFNELNGMWVVFSSSSDSGIFTPDGWIKVDLYAQPTYLNPNTWFRYDGSEENFDIELKAEVMSNTWEVIVWDTCLVTITE